MSDLSQTVHNFEDLLAGKIDFNQLQAGEFAIIEHRVSQLAAPLQPAVRVMLASFKAGASALVGAGLTGIGPILAESADTQASQVLNMLSALGVPTTPPLNIAEQAALVAGINGLKALLDRMGIHISTAGVVTTGPA